jgi:hypothetical protein
MVISNDLIIERLQDIYERAVNANNRRDFFIPLFEYIAVYDEEPELEKAIKEIVTKGRREIKNQTEYAEKALVEMRKVYKEVKDYIEKEKVTNKAAIDNLEQFTAYEEGQLTTSHGPIKGRYGYLSYVLMTLAEDETVNHLPFVRRYGTVTDEHRIKEWHFSPSYEKWEQETNWLNRIKLTRVWYSWDRLVLFYQIYRDYEKMVKTKLDNNQVWDALNINGLFGEVKEIIDGKRTEGYSEFQESEFKTHLQRLHSFIKQFLSSSQNNKSVNTYSLTDNVLVVNGKELRLKKDTRKLRLLELLTQKTRGVYFGEIVSDIEGADYDTSKDWKNTYYEVCRGISNSLAKLGITDFLIFDFNQAKISPTFKRTK